MDDEQGSAERVKMALPEVPIEGSAETVKMALPEVQIELYENGKGPRHKFTAKLQGWDANRLDLETIKNNYGLKELYAFSPENGRGQPLIFHPRNGLSFVCYSGKPGVVIRLDSDAKTPVAKIALRVILVALALALMAASAFPRSSRPNWLRKLQELGGGGIGWLAGFIVILASQLTGWPSFR